MVPKENIEAALNWIEKMLKRENKFNIELTPGVTVLDLHKFLITKRERLLSLSDYNQKVVYLQTKLMKDVLEKSR